MKISDLSKVARILSEELKSYTGANAKKSYPIGTGDNNFYKIKTSQEKSKNRAFTDYSSPNKIGF